MADGAALRLNSVSYTAQQERLIAALGMVANSTASGLSIREGKRLGSGLECSISGDGLSVVVQPGVASVSHAVASGGDYQVAIPSAVTKTLGAKPGAGQKRRDAVVIDVSDADVTQKPTALREANVQLLAGTPTSGTPSAPAAGTMQFEIGQVHFDGTNTPIVQPTNPRYVWASGGIGVVFSTSERNALPAYNGMVVYRSDTDKFEAYVNGAWQSLLGEDSGWFTYAVQSGWSNQGTRMRKIGNRVRLEIHAAKSGSGLPSGNFPNFAIVGIDPEDQPGENASADWQPTVGTGGTADGRVSLAIQVSTGTVYLTSSDNAINVGDIVRAVFEYYTD